MAGFGLKKKGRGATARRKKAAAWAKDLRSVKTTSLTPRERNRAIRSHVRHAISRKVI